MSEADISGTYPSGPERRNIHDFDVEFEPGPDIELRPLTIPDDTRDSLAHADKESVPSDTTNIPGGGDAG